MNMKEWEKIVPNDLKEDVVWRMETYRLGLFLSDACWNDSQKIRTGYQFSLYHPIPNSNCSK